MDQILTWAAGDASPKSITLTPANVTGGAITQLLPLSGGRVLAGGTFTSISDGTTTSGARLAVIDETGAILAVPGLSADGTIEAIRLQSDGKILLAGNFNNINGTARAKIARLRTDFSLDPDFNPTGPAVSPFPASGAGANNTISAIAEAPDGKIYLGGNFTTETRSYYLTPAIEDAAKMFWRFSVTR